MNNETRDIIDLQLAAMSVRLRELLEKVARRCTSAWSSKRGLDTVLKIWIQRMPYCRLLYAIDRDGIQVSANIRADSIDHKTTGQNLSDRPYFTNVPGSGFLLSNVYISTASGRSCVTAIHSVTEGGETVGYIAADFDLRDLPLLQTTCRQQDTWRRITGDVMISNHLAAVSREPSLVDQKIVDVHAILDELVCEHGIFHAKLHYSSSRVTLWLMDDPYHYRIHVLDELVDPSLCMVYRKRQYPSSALVRTSEVLRVFQRFAELRLRDPYFYLRAGSLNIMNGLVGLTFSSDDTHYIEAGQFLRRNIDVWYPQDRAGASLPQS